MIHRQRNQISIECDACDAVFDGEPWQEWREVWSAAKADGWNTTRIGLDWIHTCPTCKLGSGDRRP